MQNDVTIYDIAAKLGISATTVSRALSNSSVVKQKTCELVHRTAREMGYQHNVIASNLRKQKSQTIGLLLHELNSSFVTSVLSGIESVTFKEGYDLLIVHSAEDTVREVANAQNLFSERVDGVLSSLALNTKETDHFSLFIERNIPVVFFDRVPSDKRYTKVVIDNFKCGYDATKHLIGQGCKAIAHITADLTRNVYSDRFEGYKKALKDHKIKFREELVQICSLSKEETLIATNQILRYKPDAFFITNDFAAAVCMEELSEKGIAVPKDIAVVGFNNDVLCNLVIPKLSTIDYPGILMGETAAKLLLEKIKSKKSRPQTHTIPSQLIIRNSSKRKK